MLSLPFLMALLGPCVMDDAPTPLFGRWEGRFTAEVEASPETAVEVILTNPLGKTSRGPGFWDGGRRWLARVQPDEEGTWTYRTKSEPSVAGLDGVSGRFVCRKAGDDRFALHGPIRVASDHHHLEHRDGTAFFWMGDTVWNGPLLSKADDWETYLADRARKHFSVVQFNMLAPWRTAATDGDGQMAFTKKEGAPAAINPAFFQRMDQRMDAINRAGMLAAPVLVWALTGKDPGTVLSEDDCTRLVRYQVARYGAHQVLWVLAGDNPYNDRTADKWKRVGRAVFGQGPHAPVTTHPTGMNWPWGSWAEESWLDVLGYQSGHGDDANTLKWVHSGPASASWRIQPIRPIINLEPPYENHFGYQSRKPHSAFNVRRACYWSILATPPAGVTYGGHGVWSWHERPGEHPTDHNGTGPAQHWRDALALPGSEDMKRLVELFESLPWWTLRPSPEMVVDQPGKDDPTRFIAAARSEDGRQAVVYLPVGGKVSLKGAPNGTAFWYDPRTGERREAKAVAEGAFQAPDDNDWVLLLKALRFQEGHPCDPAAG